MKYLISLIVIIALQSCISSSAYLINEYSNFPKGLKKKEFETEVLSKNKSFDSLKDSLVPFSSLGKKKKLYLEFLFFRKTYIPINNEKIVDSLVNELISIPNRGWIWDNMYYKIYGAKGTIWVNKDIRIKTNQKVEKIMNELSTQLIFKYDNQDYLIYHLYDKIYSKNINYRLLKLKQLKNGLNNLKTNT